MSFIIDIHSQKPYPANVLSNFYPTRFVMDVQEGQEGQEVSCMEAFLQSTKCPDVEYQKVIALMPAKQAKAVGAKYNWQQDGMLYWQGHQFSRYSIEYWRLLFRAYRKLCDDPIFASAVRSSGHAILLHSVGKWSMRKTCLTTWEFLILLYWCRAIIHRNDKRNTICSTNIHY